MVKKSPSMKSSSKKSPSKKVHQVNAENMERALDAKAALWQLLDGAGSQLVTLENRLTVLRELFSARTEENGGDEIDVALLAHVEDTQAALKASRGEIDRAYNWLDAALGQSRLLATVDAALAALGPGPSTVEGGAR